MNNILHILTGVLFLTFPFVGFSQTWDGGGGDSQWGTSANWNPDGVPLSNGTANIVFDGTTRLDPFVNTDWNVSKITFTNNAAANPFILSGSNITIQTGGILQLDNDAQTINNNLTLGGSTSFIVSNATLNLNGSIDVGPLSLTLTAATNTALNVGGVITGTGALTKNGSGVLLLTASNTFTSTLTISDGSLVVTGAGRIGNNNPLQLGSGTRPSLVISNGGQVRVGSFNTTGNSNTLYVGTNSWVAVGLSNNGTLTFGTSGTNNQIVLADGGRLSAFDFTYGNNNGGNDILVTNGTQWDFRRNVDIFASNTTNKNLVISNTTFVTGISNLGVFTFASTGASNRIQLLDGGVLRAMDFTYGGGGDNLTITNGAQWDLHRNVNIFNAASFNKTLLISNATFTTFISNNSTFSFGSVSGSNNQLLISGSGKLVAQDFIYGNAGADLTITNGAEWDLRRNVNIFDSASTNKSLTISNTTFIAGLSNNGTFRFGTTGTNNQLNIIDGGKLTVVDFVYGNGGANLIITNGALWDIRRDAAIFNTSSTNKTLTIDNTTFAPGLASNGTFSFGGSGSGNQIVFLGTGKLSSVDLTYGGGAIDLLVTNGDQWDLRRNVNIFNTGSTNKSLTVSNTIFTTHIGNQGAFNFGTTGESNKIVLVDGGVLSVYGFSYGAGAIDLVITNGAQWIIKSDLSMFTVNSTNRVFAISNTTFTAGISNSGIFRFATTGVSNQLVFAGTNTKLTAYDFQYGAGGVDLVVTNGNNWDIKSSISIFNTVSTNKTLTISNTTFSIGSGSAGSFNFGLTGESNVINIVDGGKLFVADFNYGVGGVDLLITNSSAFDIRQNTAIFNTASTNRMLIISNATFATGLSNSGTFNFATTGQGNKIMMMDGGKLSAFILNYGAGADDLYATNGQWDIRLNASIFNTGSTNRSLVVSNTHFVVGVTSQGTLTFATVGLSNQIVMQDGGKLTAFNLTYGASGNDLYISNGAQWDIRQNGTIFDNNATNKSLIIGSNTTFVVGISNSGNFNFATQGGVSNQIVFQSGGKLSVYNLNYGGGAVDFVVTNGSQWDIRNNANILNTSGTNKNLLISNTTFAVSSLFFGTTGGQSNQILMVDGGKLVVSNSFNYGSGGVDLIITNGTQWDLRQTANIFNNSGTNRLFAVSNTTLTLQTLNFGVQGGSNNVMQMMQNGKLVVLDAFNYGNGGTDFIVTNGNDWDFRFNANIFNATSTNKTFLITSNSTLVVGVASNGTFSIGNSSSGGGSGNKVQIDSGSKLTAWNFTYGTGAVDFLVTNGSAFDIRQNATIFNTDATNRVLTVSNTTFIVGVSNNGSLIFGGSGTSNQIQIVDGGKIVAYNLTYGNGGVDFLVTNGGQWDIRQNGRIFETASTNKSLIISNGATFVVGVSNNGALIIGTSGSGNRIQIHDTSKLIANSLTYGGGAVDLLITNTAQWDVRLVANIFNVESTNKTFMVSNATFAVNNLNFGSNGVNNALSLGNNGLISVTNQFNYGSGSVDLLVTNGSQWDLRGNANIFNAGSTNKTLIISNTTWVVGVTNNGRLSFGNEGASNTLRMQAGGVIQAYNFTLGSNNGASSTFVTNGARIIVHNNFDAYNGNSTGQTLLVGGNSAGVSVGFSNNGSFLFGNSGTGQSLVVSNGGTVHVNRFVQTNSGSSFNLVGGTFQSRNTLLTNGQTINIGSNGAAASYIAEGGVHQFSNEVIVNTNSTLRLSNAVFYANVAVRSNATFFVDGVTTNVGSLSIDRGAQVNFTTDDILFVRGNFTNFANLNMDINGATNLFRGIDFSGNLTTSNLVTININFTSPQFSLLEYAFIRSTNNVFNSSMFSYSFSGGALPNVNVTSGFDGTYYYLAAVPEPSTVGIGVLMLVLFIGLARRSNRPQHGK
ncbi:MAG: hypothetical protein SGI71_01285 [Verrucomicrobiota bacterium]|nr:hypothetical protein [Verrucomicrobiota bacterium]